MRIDSSLLIQRLQGARPAGPVRRAEETNATGDAVQISSLAADMRVAMDALNEAPEIDPAQAERLDALQKQIESGDFQFDGGSLAKKLMP